MQEQAQRIQDLFLQGVQMLARALEAKDAYTTGSPRSESATTRSRRPRGWASAAPSSSISGWAASSTTSARSARAKRSLHKPGSLTDDEFRQITEHPALGERMLSPLARESPEVLRIVRSHHERLDGHGFPDGLRGDKIPVEARIVAVADSFDAMTTERPYRGSRPADDAVAELRRVAGTQLDPEVVEAVRRRLTGEQRPATLCLTVPTALQ